MISKGVKYFQSRDEAEKVAKKIKGDRILFFHKLIETEPRVVCYELGYAVQYCKSGSYYPEQHRGQTE